MDDVEGAPERRTWSRKKKDAAPRGLHHLPKHGRRPAGWQILFTCGHGHRHKEWIGPVKSDAIKTWHTRRNRVHDEPGWCPRAERRAAMEAQQHEADARRQAEAQSITLRDYADRWLTAHVASECRERTAEQYRSTFKHHVYPALGHLPLGDIKRTHIRSLIADKAAAGLSRSTLRNIAVPLRAMLNAAVEEDRIPGNPAARLFKRQRGRTENEAKKVTTLTEEELAKILTVASSDFAQHADILFTLAWTGLRVSEACGLQWSDLNLDGHYLEVNRAVAYRQRRVIVGAPKSGKARRVDVPADLVERLHRRLSIRQAEAMVAGRPLSPWVFPAPSDDTKPMNAAFLRFKVWYKTLRKAGVRPVRIHDLRHTYASLLLLAGEPMLYVKEQLGHSTVQVTVDLYGHVRPGLNRGAVNRLAEATRPGSPITQLHSNYTSPVAG